MLPGRFSQQWGPVFFIFFFWLLSLLLLLLLLNFLSWHNVLWHCCELSCLPVQRCTTHRVSKYCPAVKRFCCLPQVPVAYVVAPVIAFLWDPQLIFSPSVNVNNSVFGLYTNAWCDNICQVNSLPLRHTTVASIQTLTKNYVCSISGWGIYGRLHGRTHYIPKLCLKTCSLLTFYLRATFAKLVFFVKKLVSNCLHCVWNLCFNLSALFVWIPVLQVSISSRFWGIVGLAMEPSSFLLH